MNETVCFICGEEICWNNPGDPMACSDHEEEWFDEQALKRMRRGLGDCPTCKGTGLLRATADAQRPANPFDEETLSVAASATDLANSWARESGVEEADNVNGLRDVIRRLWDHWATKYYRAVEAAESRPYALGGEERRAIEDMLRIMTRSYDKWCADGYPEPKSRRIAALTAALALQEPLTREDYEDFQFILQAFAARPDCPASVIGLLAKLRAYIEARWPSDPPQT